jgi:hypothetical protein
MWLEHPRTVRHSGYAESLWAERGLSSVEFTSSSGIRPAPPLRTGPAEKVAVGGGNVMISTRVESPHANRLSGFRLSP